MQDKLCLIVTPVYCTDKPRLKQFYQLIANVCALRGNFVWLIIDDASSEEKELKKYVGATFPSESTPDSIRGTLWKLMRYQKTTRKPLRRALQILYGLDKRKAVTTEELAAKVVNLVHVPDDFSQLRRDLRALGEI